MHLSRHDLAQLDEARLRALAPETLLAVSLKLLSDLRDAHDRLNQNPDNSSRPPSSRPPWERGGEPREGDEAEASAGDEEPPGPVEKAAVEEPSPAASGPAVTAAPEGAGQKGPRPKGRPGRRPGSPGYGRQVRLAVTDEQWHRPVCCALCERPFSEETAQHAYTGRYELDVGAPTEGVGLVVSHTLHRYLECRCEGCGHVSRAAPGRAEPPGDWQVGLTEWHLVGPGLVSLICALGLCLHGSCRRIQEFLHDWLAIDLGVAAINGCLHEVGRAVEPVVQGQIEEAIRTAELVHADETGWRQQGAGLWLWVFRCATATRFVIGARTAAVVERVLGLDFSQWLMTDGYSAYRRFPQRLRCLAHLLRKARGLEESLSPLARDFGRAARTFLQRFMTAVKAARDSPPSTAFAPQLRAFLEVCRCHDHSAHEKTSALARELLNDWNTFWLALEDPTLPLTNNAAERALRHWVIARRVHQGTRTEEGSRAFALTLSVVETCRQRGASPWRYIAAVLRDRRRGLPAPPLPQPAA